MKCCRIIYLLILRTQSKSDEAGSLKLPLQRAKGSAWTWQRPSPAGPQLHMNTFMIAIGSARSFLAPCQRSNQPFSQKIRFCKWTRSSVSMPNQGRYLSAEPQEGAADERHVLLRWGHPPAMNKNETHRSFCGDSTVPPTAVNSDSAWERSWVRKRTLK